MIHVQPTVGILGHKKKQKLHTQFSNQTPICLAYGRELRPVGQLAKEDQDFTGQVGHVVDHLCTTGGLADLQPGGLGTSRARPTNWKSCDLEGMLAGRL